MIRFTKVLAVASALLVLPSAALALGIDIVNVSGAGASGVLLPGETVTFDLRIDWTGLDGAPIYGVSAGVHGYDLADSNEARQLNIALAEPGSSSQLSGLPGG